MIKLKRCPFCGGKASVVKVPEGLNWSGFYLVGCEKDMMCMGNINHFTMVFVSPQTAAEAWNRRVDNG